MNGSQASLFTSMTSRSASRGKRRDRRTKDIALLFAAGLVACFWAAQTCEAQIAVNAYISGQDLYASPEFYGQTIMAVQVIDAKTNTVIGSPIHVGNTPNGVATTPDGRYVYVANEASSNVSVINAATNTFLSNIVVGSNPVGVAVTPNGEFAFVTNLSLGSVEDGTVSVINTSTNAIEEPISVGKEPVGIAVTSQFAYIANSGSNTVSMIEVGGPPEVVATIAVGNMPQAVAVTPNGKFAYVTNSGSNSVTVISTATKSVVTTIPMPVPGGASFDVVTPDGKFVYVTSDNGTVTEISTATNTVIGTIFVGTNTSGIAVTPDGKSLYLVNWMSDSLSVVDQATNTVETTIKVLSPSVFGSFIGPNIIVAAGGPLLIANDAALTPLGFGTFVDFNGGTLQTTGSLSLNTSYTISLLASGGTIDTDGFDSIFSCSIINSGSLTKTGAGTLTLSGNNTYTGGTNIFGGTLSVTNDSNLGTGSLTLANQAELLTTGTSFSSGKAIALGNGGGTLASVTGATATYGGVISGTGPLNIGDGVNQGTIVLDAANLYTGGTTITGGILQIGNGGTTGTIIGNVVDNSSLVFNRSDAITFAGIVSGTGSLTQAGSGILTLTAANTYSGGTVIDQGTLVVDNAQALGTGNVTVNGGILATDPQPIKVKGNYRQNRGGTLQLNVAGRNPGQYDTLNVGGNAALGGTLKLISLGFRPKLGDALTLVATGGAVSGRFAQFINPFTTGTDYSIAGLDHEPNAVVLEFRTAASFAVTPNQRAAGRLLDAVHRDPRAANLLTFLDTEPFTNLPGDFERISPDGLTAFYEIGFSNANMQKLTLEGRLDDLRTGSNGFSSNMKVNGATLNDQAGSDGKSSKAVVEPVLQPGPENRWGVWVTGFGDFVNVDGDGNAQGYNFTTGGVSVGLDYRITDQLAIGVFGDYSHTWTSLNPGHIDVDSGRGGVYATWFSHGFYLNGAIYGGHNSYDSGRASLGGLANGGTEGAEWSTFISGGYDCHFGPLTVGPIASLQYTDVGIDSFKENGTLVSLAIHSDSAESLRSDAGFRTFYQWQIGKIIVEPSLKASWEHEYKYSALPVTAGFAGIPGPSATFSGPSEGHDSAVVSAGVSVQVTPAISTYVNYDGQLGRDNYDSNAVTGGVRVSF